jgi:predicted RND superfamily exporter protein
MTEERRTLLDRFSWFVTSHRVAVLVLTLIVAIGFGYGTTKMKGEVIIEELLPYAHPYLKIMAEYAEVFGSGGTFVAVAIEAKDGNVFKKEVLEKIKQIDFEVALWPETYRILTVSIAGRSTKVVRPVEDGEIRTEPLMWPEVPKTDEEVTLLKKYVYSDPNLRGILVSRDGTSAIVLTQFKTDISYERAFEILSELDEKYTDEETEIYLVGFPVLMGWIYSYKAQIMAVMAVSVVVMIGVLFLSFQNLIGMVVPMLFGLISTAMGLGFIGWTGINFSPLLYVLAFLVAARMVSHSVQITHRYMEEMVDCGDKVTACYETTRSMLIPNWAGVATDAAGFFILILVKIQLMQMVAMFMSFWMLTVALCGIITPILCTYMPLKRASEAWVRKSQKMSILDRICVGAAEFSIGKGKIFVGGGSLVALAFCVYQATGLKIGDSSPGSPLLWPDHRYNLDQAWVDETFDVSSEDFTLYYKGEKDSIYDDPQVLNTMEAFDRHMQETLPDIYKSSDSILGLMTTLNYILHEGDEVWRELPYDSERMTNLVGWTRDQVDVYTMSRYFDHDMSKTQITIYFSDHTSDNLLRIRDAAREFFDKHPMQRDKGAFDLAGGRIGMEMATNEEMKRMHAAIDGMVLATIFLLCALFYRSLVAGMMFTLPLILGNMVAFAYMSLTNIGLSINTLPVAAVGVGVGVDFAIYIYNRCMEEFAAVGGSGDLRDEKRWHDAIVTAVRTSGKAVVLTGLTMVLPITVWYFISDLKFQAQMGIFLAMILTTNVVLAITLHPLLLGLIKPKFITRRAAKQAV